jgi:Ca-activated chloride channel family protein
MRFLSLLSLLFLIGKPQLVDQKSKVTVEGIDIVMVVDVSNSMVLFDDLHDQRSRIDTAKKEAISFINKRDNDAIGLVVFGSFAITRCPLTQDKQMITSMIDQLSIDHHDLISQGTMISQALVAGARRLQKSSAKSKVLILLTDGETSSQDIPADTALQILQKFGIKVYTIGIGGDYGGLMRDPMFGVRQVGSKLQTDLLKHIAEKTGGKFFEAKKPKDMEIIYKEIDALEKSSYQTDIYSRYFDYFIPIVWFIIILLLIELLAITFLWTII